ncbi:MAG: RNA polymerase sigma factor [Gemmatimonadetes bacterium]|nr:RNA polymerase sigma factor [Gemmatimonadota bacterium]
MDPQSQQTPAPILRIRTVDRTGDAQRVEAVLAGDDDAFRDLVQQYHGLAYHVAFKVLRNTGDAEEVVQDAFVKVFGALSEFRGEASLKTWILRIVWRLSLNRQRDRSRTSWYRLGLDGDGEAEVEALHSRSTEHPDRQYQARDTQARVQNAVDRLPEPLRQALVLHGFEELGYDDVARILQVPVGTVCSRIHSARRKLAEELQRKGLM